LQSASSKSIARAAGDWTGRISKSVPPWDRSLAGSRPTVPTKKHRPWPLCFLLLGLSLRSFTSVTAISS